MILRYLRHVRGRKSTISQMFPILEGALLLTVCKIKTDLKTKAFDGSFSFLKNILLFVVIVILLSGLTRNGVHFLTLLKIKLLI